MLCKGEFMGFNDFEEIEMEESNYLDLLAIAPSQNTLSLKNDLGQQVDGDAMAEHLSRVEGINRIQTLLIQHSSLLEDVKVVKGLPGLTSLHIFGYRIRTLDGLEWLRANQYLDIDTGSNRKRRITKVAQARVDNMTLEYARVEDLEDIGHSSTIRKLQLSGCTRLPFQDWCSVPLEEFYCSRGKFSEFGDTAHVQSLRTLTLIGCRKLERFVGDNSAITWLMIDNSKLLDMRTIQGFRSVESLTFNGSSPRIAISDFRENRQLRSLNLLNCEVDLDVTDLRSSLPKLEKIHISKLKKVQVLELRDQNPGVSINECF
jgi:hypothetical protein